MHLNVLLTEYNLYTTSAHYEHFQSLPTLRREPAAGPLQGSLRCPDSSGLLGSPCCFAPQVCLGAGLILDKCTQNSEVLSGTKKDLRRDESKGSVRDTRWLTTPQSKLYLLTLRQLQVIKLTPRLASFVSQEAD